MSRYIDADKLKQDLDAWAINLHKPTNLVRNDTFVIIDEQPAADVVEVVRCKDCKRGGWRVSELDNKTKGYRCAIHAVLGFDFGDNGYCSYGERKDNEDK